MSLRIQLPVANRSENTRFYFYFKMSLKTNIGNEQYRRSGHFHVFKFSRISDFGTLREV